MIKERLGEISNLLHLLLVTIRWGFLLYAIWLIFLGIIDSQRMGRFIMAFVMVIMFFITPMLPIYQEATPIWYFGRRSLVNTQWSFSGHRPYNIHIENNGGDIGIALHQYGVSQWLNVKQHGNRFNVDADDVVNNYKSQVAYVYFTAKDNGKKLVETDHNTNGQNVHFIYKRIN